MAAPNTVLTYPLNGTLKDFAIPFEYLARKFITVTLVGATRRVLLLNSEYRFTTKSQVSTIAAWGPSQSFDTIEIRRVTSATERLVDFSDGSILRAYDLNTAQIQSLHIAEEARDLTADTIGVNNDGDLDARGRRIVRVADAVNDDEAVSLRQQKTWANTALNYAATALGYRDQAGQQASVSNNAATLSIQARDLAGQQAQVASNAATLAIQARDLAGQQATAANTAATNSNTARIAAETARDQAGAQATVAVNAANGISASAAKINDHESFIAYVQDRVDVTKGATKIGYSNRTVFDRLQADLMYGDFASGQDALAIATSRGQGVKDSQGASYKDVYNNTLNVFQGTSNWKGASVFKSKITEAHAGQTRIAQSVEMTTTGSGANGPSNASYAFSIMAEKKDFFSSTQPGELDGLNITVRQGGRRAGGVNSDCAGVLINTQIVKGSGWAGAIEAQTSSLDPTSGALVNQLQTGINVIDSVTDSYYGFTATANVGLNSAAFMAYSLPGGSSWKRFIEYRDNLGQDVFNVNGSGWINLYAPSGSAPRKTIKAVSDSLVIMSNDQTREIMNISDQGETSISGGYKGTKLTIQGPATAGTTGQLVIGSGTANAASAGGVAVPTGCLAYLVVYINGTKAGIPLFAVA